jgi:hypothetical protein
MKRASYRHAVQWIALNDEAGNTPTDSQQIISDYVTTALIADLFDVTTERVARDVLRYRTQHGGER